MNKLNKRINLLSNKYSSKFSIYEIFVGDNVKNIHPFLIFLKNNKLAGIDYYSLSAFNQSLLYIRLDGKTISIPFFDDGKLLTEKKINRLKAFKPNLSRAYELTHIKEIIFTWNLLQKFNHQEVFNILIDCIRMGAGNSFMVSSRIALEVEDFRYES